MRHRIYGKKLGRNKNERTSLFRNLTRELFLRGTITTSRSKAAAIKGMVDKIINLAKNKNSQRLIQAFFADKLLQERLIKEIAPMMQNRTSGYTSVMKIGVQAGDSTTLVKMSLIGLEQLKPLEKKVSKVSAVPKVSKEEKSVSKKRTVTKRRIMK